MPLIAAKELSEGIEALDVLIAEIAGHAHDWNETETRFHIINRLIVECFGWEPAELVLERHDGGEFSDYELGNPVVSIWEAKREGKGFEIPVKRSGSIVHNLASLMRISGACRDSIVQVNSYCVKRGVEIAVATNGHQIIAFKAVQDLSEDTKHKCVVIDSLEALRSIFPRAWQLLSPMGASANALGYMLSKASAPSPAEKLAKTIPNYPQIREANDLQRSMSDLAELLLLNIAEQPEIEERFYQECYCESGALGQHALISKQMLSTRYASLFPDEGDASSVQPVSGKRNKPQLTPEIFAEAISNRPIALVGDVGVGKSSFLKHLMYVSAFAEFQHAIYAYVNLGRKGALRKSLIDLVLDQIEEALVENYAIDIYDAAFVKSVYKKEIKRFDKTIYGQYKQSNPSKYEDHLIDFLGEKQGNRSEHIRMSVDYLSTEKRKQIIIALDNADQRNQAIQQDAFIISQNLSADWKATVFISVRPRTFFLSKRSGTLAAYPHRIFTIAPPRIDEMISKRLAFALEIAEGKISLERLKSITFKLGNISTLIRMLITSIEQSDEIKLFLENITGGNIRELVQFLSGMLGNPNIDIGLAIRVFEKGEQYNMPIHEFWKVALRGEYNYYDPEKAMAANLFSAHSDDAKEHFLMPLILALLDENAPRRDAEGFVTYPIIVREMQSLGFKPSSVEASIRMANNKKLIDAPERMTFEEDEDGLYGLMPRAFRINTIGAYHLKVWMTNFSYMDAVCVDTPIFDENAALNLRELVRQFDLGERYKKTVQFRDYLSTVWSNSGLTPTFFDWEAACKTGQESFNRTAFGIARRASHPSPQPKLI